MRQEFINVTAETRARMQAVRQHGTGAEMRVRRTLHLLGYRFRLHRNDLPGKPDIVLPGRKKIIMVNGCFWHGHAQCKRAKLPKSNVDLWCKKIESNRARDSRNILALKSLGWEVLTVWECETRNPLTLAVRLEKFLSEN